MEVRYQGRVCYPLTIRAHILSQQEKDNLPEWRPEGMVDLDVPGVKNNGFAQLGATGQLSNLGFVERKPPTELKGTTYITHHFDANSNEAQNSGSLTDKNTQLNRYPGVLTSNLVAPVGATPYMQNLPNVVPSTVIQTPLCGPLPTHGYLGSSQDAALLQGLPPEPSFLNQQPMSRNYYGEEGAFGFGGGGGALGDFNDMANFSNMIQDILENGGDSLMAHGSGSAFDPHRTPAVKTEHHRDFTVPVDCKPLIQEVPIEEEDILVHEFEFANLEFVKPTRMSKVYICFACTILDCDLLYCVYHIPTVGICRAEQRRKACEKLGIPMVFSEYGISDALTGDHTRSEASVHSGPPPKAKRRQQEGYVDLMEEAQDAGNGLEIPEQEDSETSRVDGFDHGANYSRQALRDWINEEYESTGLKRRLTELDMQTLESQAGFPMGGGATGVSPNQWNEFTTQFRDVLKMLKRIGGLWDREDPCVISGLHLDRRGTVQALSAQPTGTFVCRLSWSMPGTLVLSCKVQPNMAQADDDGLMHVVIRIDDLQVRKLDTWIRDFPSALHVLDIYTQKRVDKRKVFHSNYHRMKHLEDVNL